MQQKQQKQQTQTRPEGEVTIEKNNVHKNTNYKKDLGDYVDFEEVDK